MSGMKRTNARRLLAVATITTLGVCALATGAWALTHRQNDGPPVPKYASAHDMAQRARCAATFHALPAPIGVRSAGECTIARHVVGFRVQRAIDTADPWPTASGGQRSPNIVGNGWIVHSADVKTLDAVGARLAP
jgi:hypothetical protein